MIRRLRVLALLAGCSLLAGTALTGTSTVSTSRADIVREGVTVNTVRPAACSGLVLSRIVTGSGTIDDTNDASLILGSSSADMISGRGRDDCIVGGGDADVINGGGGTDVCLGGPGIDVFTLCETSSQ